MTQNDYGPIPGSTIFRGISGQKTIIMAANTRIATVAKGIFRAAKETDSAVFMELERGVYRTNTKGFLRKDAGSCKGDTV
jgi:hypothetical protein